MLRIIRSFGEDLPSACQNTAGEIWQVLDHLLTKYGSVRDIAEHVCSTLRFGLEFYGTGVPGLADQTQSVGGIIPSLLSRLSACFNSTGFPCFIWISGKAIRLFGNEDVPDLRAAFSASFESISSQTFALLEVQSVNDVPDRELSFTFTARVCYRLFTYYPT
jgi:transportin-3